MITDEKKQWVLDQLTQGDVVVEFTKVNGDYRRMTCTLNENIVPTPTKTDPLTQKKVRAINEEVCIAFTYFTEPNCSASSPFRLVPKSQLPP